MIELSNVWSLFGLLITLAASLLGTLTGILFMRLFAVSVAGFLSVVWDATLNHQIFEKGGTS